MLFQKEKEDKNQINRLDQKRERRSRRAFFLLSPISRKTLSGKVSLCTFLKKASLTLETAMALPLFFFGVLINAVKTALDELVGTVDATTAIDTFNEIETFLAGVTNEKTLTGMLAVTDGKAVTAQTTADAAKSTAQTALSKATANETKLNTIPEMPENDGKIYGFCNGAWVVIAEVGKNVYTD